MKRTTTPKGTVIAALDIGSTKIGVMIGRTIDDANTFEVVGVGHQASSGIKAGTIIDMNAAESAIRQAVHTAENMASDALKGYPLREVVVNLPGNHARSHNLGVDVQVLGHEITDNDVSRALARAQDQVLSEGEELVHTIPAMFSIDGHAGIREPRGMCGQSLRVDAHLLTGETGALQNLGNCLDRSHLDITAFCLEGYAAGLATLVEDEMDLGCTVIDIGGGVTSFAVFQGGAMIYAGAVPVGGEHVSGDIARVLTTSMAGAERIKTLYGSAIASSTDENEMIDVPPVGEEDDGTPNLVERAVLIGIIQPRLEEIFEMVRDRLAQVEIAGTVGRRVVLTGGTSQMTGIRDLAKRILNKDVRLGRPIRLHGLPDSVSGPAFASTAGLLTYIAERSHEMPAEIQSQAEPESLWERARLWLRENW